MAGKLHLHFCLLLLVLVGIVNSASVPLSQDQNEKTADAEETVQFVGDLRVCRATITSNNGVNIRERPTSRSRKVGALPYGANVEVEEIERNGENVEGDRTWYRMYRGWFTARYAKIHCGPGPVTVNVKDPHEANVNTQMDFSSDSALA